MSDLTEKKRRRNYEVSSNRLSSLETSDGWKKQTRGVCALSSDESFSCANSTDEDDMMTGHNDSKGCSLHFESMAQFPEHCSRPINGTESGACKHKPIHIQQKSHVHAPVSIPNHEADPLVCISSDAQHENVASHRTAICGHDSAEDGYVLFGGEPGSCAAYVAHCGSPGPQLSGFNSSGTHSHAYRP